MAWKANLLWIGAALGTAGVLFQTSYQVKELERELNRLNAEILHEQETSHVLRAEWAYLNDPARLQALVEAHLPLLGPSDGSQITALGDLPERLPGVAGAVAGAPPLPPRKPEPAAGIRELILATYGVRQ